MPRLVMALLCVLAGSAWAGPSAAATPEGKPSRAAETLWQLRGPVHARLVRDIGEKTLPENRAYADLILAYGLARAGTPDQAKTLLRIEEVLVKIGRVPDTYTSATHYSRYHLMILEAAVLGLSGSDDF